MGFLKEIWESIKDTLNVFKADPTHVGMGAAFGVFLGCVPASSGLVALIAFFVALTDTSAAAAFLVGLAIKTLSIYVLDPTSWELGRSICESDWANAHASWFGAPVVALLGLERYHVMGGAILGTLCAIPTFVIGRRVWQVFHFGKNKAAARLALLRKKKAEGDVAAGEELARLEAAGAADAGSTPSAAAAVVDAAANVASMAAGATPASAPAAAATGKPATKKAGPLKRVWRALPKRAWIVALVIVAFDLAGLKPAVRFALQKKFPEVLAKALGVVNPDGSVKQMGKVTWSEDDYEVSFLKGKIRMSDLHIANPKNPSQDLFAAKGVTVNLDRFALLRRQIVLELVQLDQPQIAVARGQDGTLSVEPTPTTPPPPQAQQTDWAQKARDAFDRAKKEADERRKKQEEEKKKAEEDKKNGKKPEPTDEQKQKLKRPTTLAEAEERAAAGIPGANARLASPPRWTVEKVESNGLDVNLQDPQSTSPTPNLTFKTGNLLELVQDRRYQEIPSECHLDGSLVDAQKKPEGAIKLDFTIDPQAQDESASPAWKLTVRLTDVDLHATDSFYAGGVPLSFSKGTCTISLDAQGSGLDSALQAAPRISFKDVEAHPRDPSRPIAGMDATKVAQEVTNAGSFELNDVTLSGSLLAPQVSLGNTLRDLVVQGGINAGKKAAQQQIDKGIDKLGQKVPGAGDKLDDAKKAAGGLLDGFGK